MATPIRLAPRLLAALACLAALLAAPGGPGATAESAQRPPAAHRTPPASRTVRQGYYAPGATTGASTGAHGPPPPPPPTQTRPPTGIQKCTRQSILLARQVLAHELIHINQFNSIWFSDLDRDELLEGQKHSLSNIVMSGAGASLLNSNGQPLIELEASYFRAQAQPQAQPIALKLLRRHQDRCHLNPDKRQFTYIVGLSLGPLRHHLDLVYNLPKELSLGQPLGWRYAQVSLSVPRMNYEITLRQTTDRRATSEGIPLLGGCALEVADVTFLAGQTGPLSIQSHGLAANNQTLLQVERLFDDYTRPSVSARLRQLLKFYLNTKTLPLATTTGSHHHGHGSPGTSADHQ